jgi:nucleoside phosphorylase
MHKVDMHKVDIGILTIRDDEFRAVLDAFPHKAGAGVHKGASRQYILREAEVATGERYTVAILCQVEQGNDEAQDAARDLIEDLAPQLVLVVGIAGGLPSDDVTLGDVVLGTWIHEYTVKAFQTGHEVTYAATGGPIRQTFAATVVALAGREDELGDWTSGLPSQPTVAWTEAGQVYGPPEWQREPRRSTRGALRSAWRAYTTPIDRSSGSATVSMQARSFWGSRTLGSPTCIVEAGGADRTTSRTNSGCKHGADGSEAQRDRRAHAGRAALASGRRLTEIGAPLAGGWQTKTTCAAGRLESSSSASGSARAVSERCTTPMPLTSKGDLLDIVTG